ncbi:MAG: glycoside hydrolase family 88 protein [Candidatus Ornithomonoglobus sp.]
MNIILDERDKKWISEVREKLEIKLCAECERMRGKIPGELDSEGKYTDADNIFWWTNGFWAGILWQMYKATGDDMYKNEARITEKRLDKALEGFEGLDHDIGFMFLHTAVADYRLTGDKEAYRRGMHAATILAGRYNPLGGYIRAWNPAYDTVNGTIGLTIVDTLMNLPLLFWAYNETGDIRFKAIAEAHADKALNYTLRPDGSSNHKVIFDPETGEYIKSDAGQGYETGSSWSRGLSWAIYGMALASQYTGRVDFLDAAKRSAHYFLACSAMTDYIPLADFRAPAEPVVYDTSAGLCAACGMLEIAEQCGDFEKPLYIDGAIKLLHAITDKCCDWTPENDAITNHSTRAYHDGRHIHLIYADYFLTEAILRLTGEGFLIW